jgi:glycosyltransferase involved in cell wall biosynthesis
MIPSPVEAVCQLLRRGVQWAEAAGVRDVVVVTDSALATREMADIPGTRVTLLGPECFRIRGGKLTWSLPPAHSRPLILLFDSRHLSFDMLRQARRAGYGHVISAELDGWSTASTALRLAARGREALRQRLLVAAARRFGFDRKLRPRAIADAVERARHLLPPKQPRSGRVLMLTPSLAMGGAERRLAATVQTLAPTCSDLWVFSGSLNAALGHDRVLPQCLESGVPLLHPAELLGHAEEALAKQLTRVLGCLSATVLPDLLLYLAAIRKLAPAAVHLWQDHGNVAGGIAALVAGVPRIILGQVSVAPDHFPHWYPEMQPVYRDLAHRPEVVMINNSAAGAKDYERWLDLEAGRVRVVHNGIGDLRATLPAGAGQAVRASHGIAPDAPVIGVVQRMDPVKDPDLWMDTAAQVAAARPDAVFLLVGDGPARAAMERRSATLGLAERCRFTGALDDPRAALDAMDVFLLTSRTEGLPNAVIEAQILGVPVVAAAVGGVPETIADGVSGRLITGRAPGSFASAILEMLNRGRKAAQSDCRTWALENFGTARLVRQCREIYGLGPCA